MLSLDGASTACVKAASRMTEVTTGHAVTSTSSAADAIPEVCVNRGRSPAQQAVKRKGFVMQHPRVARRANVQILQFPALLSNKHCTFLVLLCV